jgi:hypothetical protein
MELMARWVRQSGMMSLRQVRRTVLAVLLCSAVAGCASATASSSAAGPAAGPASSGAATTSSATSAATASAAGGAAAGGAAAGTATGCAGVNQATSVTVRRTMHLVEPTRMGALTTTQSKPTLVRALFGQLCGAVSHPDPNAGMLQCPADFGVSYTGTFYDGGLVLAKFDYSPSGCEIVSLTANGKTRTTVMYGTAAAAAPHLRADMAAVLGIPATMLAQPRARVNPGGPNKPLRQVGQVA